jgi:hypothetical protein
MQSGWLVWGLVEVGVVEELEVVEGVGGLLGWVVGPWETGVVEVEVGLLGCKVVAIGPWVVAVDWASDELCDWVEFGWDVVG